MRFDNQVALVTGAAHGMGRANAQRLSSEGASVVLADLDLDTAERVAEEIPNAVAVRVDVTQPADAHAAVKAAVDNFGRLDILVNNAGGPMAKATPFTETPDGLYEMVQALNLGSQWHFAQAAVPVMREQGRGKIVNIGSVIALDGLSVGMVAYGAAKGGVVAFTRALAREVGQFNITVNTVSPGGVGGDPSIKPFTPEEWQEITERRMRVQTMKTRRASADDVAAAVAFFAAPESDLITGQPLVVDGGAYMH